MKRMTIGSLTQLLKSLPKSMSVQVFINYEGYTDNIYLWAEGHDHRHFVALMNDKWTDKPKHTTVGSMLHDLSLCYKEKSKDYRDSITIQVDAPPKYFSSTSVVDITVKNGVLYLKGLKPSYLSR